MPGISSITEVNTAISLLVPGVPSNFLDYTARRAIRRFLVESTAWRETVDIQTTLDGDDQVELTYGLTLTNTEAFIVRIMNVWMMGDDGLPIRPPIPDSKYVFSRSISSIVFLPEHRPSREGLTYRLELAIAPLLHSDDLPTYLLERWMDGFVAGACADLLEIPGRPWSDLDQAQYWRNRELGYINRAAHENATNGVSRTPFISA